MGKRTEAGRTEGEPVVEQQARQQTGQQQVRLRIDEREMTTCYANAFRTNGTAEEVMLDFGLNLVVPAPTPPGQEGQQPPQQPQPEILFQVKERVILNYYSAKRLAITLSQLIRRHEEQFGELELDVAKRRKGEG
jgi:hypothetical protein